MRMPVLSISMRPLIGMVQPLARPGICSAAFIRLMSSSCEMRSGVTRRRAGFSHPGAQAEYHVSTWRHWDLGLRVITVSSIESGAGSVGVSARPAFPNTRSTSGNCRMMRSVTCSKRCASAIEMPGMVEGM